MSMSKYLALMLAFLFLMLTINTIIVSGDKVAENSWASKAPMHVARGGLGIASVDGKIYAIGGSSKSGPSSPASIVGTNEEYDPAMDAWTFRASMHTPRYDFAVAVCQNKIYCIGGYIANASSLTGATRTGANEVYDPATDTWETKKPMPTPRSTLQANVVNDKIYLIGGFIDNNTSPSRYSTTSLNEVYDPSTDTWTQKTPSPQMTYDFASTVFSDKIYVFCGRILQPVFLRSEPN